MIASFAIFARSMRICNYGIIREPGAKKSQKEVRFSEHTNYQLVNDFGFFIRLFDSQTHELDGAGRYWCSKTFWPQAIVRFIWLYGFWNFCSGFVWCIGGLPTDPGVFASRVGTGVDHDAVEVIIYEVFVFFGSGTKRSRLVS